MKFKKLDSKFANDVFGDGDENVVGLFEAALRRFYPGQVIPTSVAGWFGEIKKEFKDLIKWQQRKMG